MNTKDLKGTYFSCADIEDIYSSVKEEFMELFSNLDLKQSETRNKYDRHANVTNQKNDNKVK